MLEVVFTPCHPRCRCYVTRIGAAVGKGRCVILSRIIGSVILGQQLSPELRSPDIIVIIIYSYANRSVSKIRCGAGAASAESVFPVIPGSIKILVFGEGDKAFIYLCAGIKTYCKGTLF